MDPTLLTTLIFALLFTLLALGINVFVIKGMAEGVPLGTVFAGVTPFIVAQILLIAIVVAFPVIALWLPNTMP